MTGIYDKYDQTLCEAWAFLGKHPLGSPTDVYVKVGLHNNLVYLNLITLDIDRRGEIRQAIHDYLTSKSKKRES